MTSPGGSPPAGADRPTSPALGRFWAGYQRPWGHLAALGHRGRQVLLLAGLTGAVTGLAVAGFDWLIRDQMFERLGRLPVPLQVVAPLVGLVLAAAALQWVAHGSSPSTADEYIHNFHEPGRRLDLRPLPGRILASVMTLGLGGAMGYEGPSIYIGAAFGSALQGRFSRMFSREDAKVLLVAGAAAGVAAIFKAPATGLVFALEVPYQEDLARRMLLPAGIAAAASYVVFAAFYGTAPLIPIQGSPPFSIRDLGGALVLGVLCGLGARLFTQALVRAKRLSGRTNPWVRATSAGVGLAGVAAAAYALFGSPLTLGPGYNNLLWASDPRRTVLLVVALMLMRAAATILTVAGGGAGGLFIPLVVEGALLGRAFAGVVPSSSTGSNFFPLVGVAAFLGAGYRVPLAAIVFVAEASGRPGFIVPGLIAAMVSQLFMGSASASTYQVASRAGHLERRFGLPLSSAMQPLVVTIEPGVSLAEFYSDHAVGRREHAVAVVDNNQYLGMVRMEELVEVPHETWASTPVADVMRTDFPTGSPDWLLRDALRVMEDADLDLLPVTDRGNFVGVVTTTEILKLDDILQLVDDEDR